MAASQPPTEDLPAFNSTVFKDANASTLSLSQAQSLFLGRTGNATSIATSTNFSDDVNVSNGDITISGGRITLNGTGIEYDSTGENVAFGSINLGTNQNTCLGSGTSTAGGYGIAIGYVADVQSGTSGCMAIGANSSVAQNLTNAVAFGNNATVTTNNSIVLGTATETVRCPGTASNTSLVATSNITVAGLTVGTSNSSLYPGAVGNTLFGVSAGTAINNASADHNTLIGNTAGVAITSAARNTAVGFASLNANIIGTDNTAVGYNSLNKSTNSTGVGNTAFGSNALPNVVGGGSNIAVGPNAGLALDTGNANIFIGTDFSTTATAGNKITSGSQNVFVGPVPVCAGSGRANSTILGFGCTITGDFGCAIGSGASAAANQISLGRTNEYVTCNGTSTSNGSLQLAGALRLQTGTYAATPGATMLGYQLTVGASGVSITTITSLSPVSYSSLILTAGVWAVNYTVELNASTSVTATAQTFYFATSTGGAYSTRIANTGTTRIHTSNVYASGDTPAFSGAGEIYTSSGTTIYPTVLINYTGTLTGTGFATATRIG